MVVSVRTRSRSGRDGAVLGSKKTRQGLPSLYGSAQILPRFGFFEIFYYFTHVGKMIKIGEKGKYNKIQAHYAENIYDELVAYENSTTNLKT